MPDFGKIKWETKVLAEQPHAFETNVFESVLNCCEAKLPNQNLAKFYYDFSAEKEQFHQQIKTGLERISQQPFLAAFLAWVKEITSDSSTINFETIIMLLENDFIGITDENGRIWTLANAKIFDHRKVIEAIRCHLEWSLILRENLVSAYLDFMEWLSNATFGYIGKLEDPDQVCCQGRAISHSTFINFLMKLTGKDQLVAKLLYFGGSRTMDEVLNLKIEDVSISRRSICFNSQEVTYPLHVFADINVLAKQRRKGLLFIGRQNALLNPATLFRSFKEAAVQIGLGNFFTPKRLTINL